ncbi:MAG: outer membrane beta-barrel protein [Cytophagales bacterium]
MKKNIIIALISFSTLALAQEKELKFGLKAFPALAWSRVEPEAWTDGNGIKYNYAANPAQFRGGFGIYADYYYNDNVAFNFGLNYIFNSSGYTITSSDNSIASVEDKREYSIQYVQLPLALKLISNEVVDNIKIYFSAGLALNVTSGANVDGKSTYQANGSVNVTRYTSEISLFALDFITSTGVEYELDNGMKLLLGVSYMHGLFDLNTRSEDRYKKSGFAVRNSLFALDVGIKF